MTGEELAVPVSADSVSAEILSVDGVSVSLAGRQILDEVTFGIGPGEFTGLIGPNGAGKDDAAAGNPRPATA